MGIGDWNDGMNCVGAKGKGESVWLSFFLYDVLERFTTLAKRRGDLDFAAHRPRRLDLVHRLGGLAVPPDGRIPAGTAA